MSRPVVAWDGTGRITDDTGLPLELCTGDTPECPHYACPDGWHPGDSPNCACTPDCALADEDEDPDPPYPDPSYCGECGVSHDPTCDEELEDADGLVLIAGVLYDRETGWEAESTGDEDREPDGEDGWDDPGPRLAPATWSPVPTL